MRKLQMLALLRWTSALIAGVLMLGCDQPFRPADSIKARRPIPMDQLRFVQLQRDSKNELRSLDVSVVQFVPSSLSSPGISVDLIGAVHIGDEDYYKELNRRFRGYDAVLYELVAPAGTRVGRGQQTSSLVSAIQRQMKQLLGLTFQLDEVDYSRRNMVHADLSPAEVEERMRQRGETWLGIMIGVMAESMKQSTGKPWANDEARLLLALFSPNRDLELKRVMAEQMSDLKLMTKLFEGANGSTMITDRNERALEVLQDQIEQGKKRLAIFYGAGHMPDLAKRLIDQYELVPVQEEWLEAWNLRARP